MKRYRLQNPILRQKFSIRLSTYLLTDWFLKLQWWSFWEAKFEPNFINGNFLIPAVAPNPTSTLKYKMSFCVSECNCCFPVCGFSVAPIRLPLSWLRFWSSTSWWWLWRLWWWFAKHQQMSHHACPFFLQVEAFWQRSLAFLTRDWTDGPSLRDRSSYTLYGSDLSI